MEMRTVKIHFLKVQRGSLLPGWAGAAVADTLSVDERGPFWRDRSNGRHYADPNGMIEVYAAPVRTDAVGKTRGKSGASHALKAGTDEAICPNGRRSKGLDVWESGTALASVTCEPCRRALKLMTTA